MRGEMDEVFPVIIRNDLRVPRQYLGIQFVYLFLQGLYDLRRVFPFAHDHDGFDDVILVLYDPVPGRIDGVGPADMPQAGKIGDLDIGDVFDQYGNIVDILDDDIPDLVDIVQKADAPDHIGLIVIYDNVPAYIYIAFLDGGIDIEG